ncbi:MAG TPA: FAD-binding oxidoreductase [Acidocella sp.]|jgi:gamma-glutamylputrescine oxidase|uniref:NAD(P)/FAD-dependent oxidoreductase n=1 Tax=Acidocella sp. TaxID=50710 RepID=UPI002C54D84D|nr:FAD-binding oxidoreductase [Acidocella sp.]HVE21546.1 FAD-binding oxidoreductase [Acidocella sp.]
MTTDNYYQATKRVALTAPALDQDLNVDVAIIGGGITGVSAALHLAERGYDVALLEAHDIGWGASGRNGGQVLAGFGVGQVKLKKLVGAEPAQRLWDMSVEAVNLLHAQIRRFDIPCDPMQGYLHAALKARQVRELEETQEEYAQLGAPVGRILRGDELRARLASPRYLAALEDKLAGHIHPLNYTLGLAAAAQRAGAKLFAQTRVTEVTPGRRIKIRAGGHEIRASYLLTAGGAYLGELMRPLTGYIMPVSTYIIATESRADMPRLIPGNEAVADLNFVLDYFRRSPDDRLLFGGRVSYSTLPPPALKSAMLARAVRVFPQLRDARVEHVWGGNVDITRNRAPHFGRLTNNILFCHGFSGHGVALTGLAGKLAAEAIAGQAERFDAFTRIPHARFPGGRAFRVPALLLATAYYRLRDMF